MTEDARMRCLVVDDSESLRPAVVRGLTRLGCDCRGAASGREALEALQRDPHVDVVISDLRMPELDGVALLAAVRERYPDMVFVILTGVADVDTAVECLRAGAYDYIVKPFQLEQLHLRIRHAFDKRRLTLENRRYQAHLAELVQQQATRIEELFLEGIQSIVHALEAKDHYTQGHSARVAQYAVTTARQLGVEPELIQLIELGAELHDVGKIGIDDAILHRAGPLTPEEYAHVQQHTVIGARILQPLLKNADAALEIVRSHHERIDGTGLPDGLRGEAIPFPARLVAVVDAFDAMTTARSYRAEMTPAAAMAELVANAGRQFDGLVVEAFAAAYPALAELPIATPPAHFPAFSRRVSGAVPAVGELP
jgi:response regulator RpfG family c-di-GMP phosphodiesterase